MCLWSWHWRRGSLLLSLPSIQWKQKTVSAGDKDIWSNTSAKGVLPQSVTLLLTPSSFSMFTTRPDASARRYWRQRFSVFSSMDDDCKPTIQEQSRKFVKTKNIFSSAWSSLVWILLNSDRRLCCVQTYFTVRIRRTFVIIMQIKIPLHLKFVAKLPCEMSLS